MSSLFQRIHDEHDVRRKDPDYEYESTARIVFMDYIDDGKVVLLIPEEIIDLLPNKESPSAVKCKEGIVNFVSHHISYNDYLFSDIRAYDRDHTLEHPMLSIVNGTNANADGALIFNKVMEIVYVVLFRANPMMFRMCDVVDLSTVVVREDEDVGKSIVYVMTFFSPYFKCRLQSRIDYVREDKIWLWRIFIQ